MGCRRKARPGFWDHWCGQCGKKRFRTRGEAKNVIHLMEHRGVEHPRSAERMQAYHCPSGVGWHVGHSGILKAERRA